MKTNGADLTAILELVDIKSSQEIALAQILRAYGENEGPTVSLDEVRTVDADLGNACYARLVHGNEERRHNPSALYVGDVVVVARINDTANGGSTNQMCAFLEYIIAEAKKSGSEPCAEVKTAVAPTRPVGSVVAPSAGRDAEGRLVLV